MSKLLLDKKDLGKRVAGTLGIPAVFAIVLFSICAASGVSMLGDNIKIISFLSYIAIVMLTTFALSINLGSGRFDFSLGSIAVLSSVISAKISYSILNGGEGSGILLLVLCVLVGACLGAISGGLYVLLRIPPIITSLGVTLIFEGVTFAITSGKRVATELTSPSIFSIRSSVWLFVLIIVISLAIIYFIFDRTKFGHNYKALREGQKVSITTGIKEVPNAIVCYIICGALMGIVGFIRAINATSINPSVLNFGSIGIMFTAFLPMFIGGFIGRFSNDKLGYFLAAVCMALLNSTFLAFGTTAGLDTTRSVVEAVLLVVFLIYLNNEKLVKDIITLKHLREYIKKRKNVGQSAGA